MYENYLETWNEYVSLEKDFKSIIEYIPLVDEHLGVWSLKLGDLLIVLGSVIDSFFKVAIREPILDQEIPDIEKIRNKERLDMGDCREVFDKYYNLSSKYVYIRPMEKRIKPFENWANNGSLK